MNAIGTKRIFAIALGLGMSLVSWSTVQAQSCTNCAPRPVIVTPDCAAPAPAAKHPTDLPADGKAGDQQAQPQVAAPDMSGSDLSSAGEAGGSAGVGMQGRADFGNRFNLFDNMAAIPMSRVWMGYQYVSNFNTGFTATSGARQVNLYRFGAEVALSNSFSIAVQDQFIGTSAAAGVDAGATWAAPQYMGKFALINEQANVWSATLGFAPQISTNTDLKENTTRIVPGLLGFYGLSDDAFFQGGGQFSIPTSKKQFTLDYALCSGYWIYRDSSLNVSGGSTGESSGSRRIQGLISQVELFGMNTLAGGSNSSYSTANNFVVSQDSAVNPYWTLDLTVGTRVLFTQRLSMGTGISVPLTGDQTKEFELLSTLNYNF